MDRVEAAAPSAPETRSAGLAADDPSTAARLQRIAGLAALVFSISRTAIALFEDGEVHLAARIAPPNDDWPPAAELQTRWRGLREPAISTGKQGFHAAAPLIAADGPVLGVIILDEPAARRASTAGGVQALSDLAALAVEEVTRRRDEAERETLVAELDHRVKNVLAAVQSLAAQSARKASSLEGFLKTFAGRLKSMASAHQLLTATRWRGAGMQNIAAAELGGLAPGQTRWQGPDLLLTPRAANAMSLALHELATNAVKFGALSTEFGRVEVVWQGTSEGGLELLWTEAGGPPVAPPTRRGFGATLLDKVTGRELGGEARVEHRREGVRATLVAGASALACQPAASPATPARVAEAPSLTGASAGAPYLDPAGRIKGLRVLIVEDALLLALELEAGLSEAGAKVAGSAADVEEGLRMAELPLDAAVLDANLNGESVLPVAQALAARGVPFVFATGYGDSKFAPQGFDAPLIKKPYDVTQVAAALAEITGRAAPQAPREPITAA
jgi:two-component sensor histidine kinase/CheY-like chemotaxis protein